MKRDTEKENQRQVRSYHATNRNEIILPFLPEMVAFVFFAGGWIVYRGAQGKPITPDEALRAQEAYRKHEEKLRRQEDSRRRHINYSSIPQPQRREGQ